MLRRPVRLIAIEQLQHLHPDLVVFADDMTDVPVRAYPWRANR
jgi:DNA/RNA-binding domain of Phe-tRNA-synthetase-like protein